MEEVKKLDPNVISYWIAKCIQKTGKWLIICIVPMVIHLLWLKSWTWITYVAIPLEVFFFLKAMFFIAYGVHVKYARHSYLVTSEEIVINDGNMWVSSSVVIPMNRVQHVDKEQGIIAKKYDISEITIHTAGEGHTIVGLKGNDSDLLRSEIIKHAKIGESDVYKD